MKVFDVTNTLIRFKKSTFHNVFGAHPAIEGLKREE